MDKTPEKEHNPAHHAAHHHEAQSHLDLRRYPEHRAAPEEHHPKAGAFSTYLHSFKKLKSFDALMIILYDIGFFALLIGFLYLYSYLLGLISSPFSSVNLTSLAQQSVDQLSVYRSALLNVAIFMFLLSFAFFLVSVLLWSVSRGLIWTRLLGKKYDLKYLWKSYLLNLIWIVLWFAAFFVIVLVFYKSAAENMTISFILGIITLVVAIIMIYFTYLLYYAFTHELKIFSSIRDAFKKGVLKFTKLVLPVGLVLGTFIVVWFVAYLLNYLSYIPFAGNVLKEVLAYILFFGFCAWVKIYGVEVLKHNL